MHDAPYASQTSGKLAEPVCFPHRVRKISGRKSAEPSLESGFVWARHPETTIVPRRGKQDTGLRARRSLTIVRRVGLTVRSCDPLAANQFRTGRLIRRSTDQGRWLSRLYESRSPETDRRRGNVEVDFDRRVARLATSVPNPLGPVPARKAAARGETASARAQRSNTSLGPVGGATAGSSASPPRAPNSGVETGR